MRQFYIHLAIVSGLISCTGDAKSPRAEQKEEAVEPQQPTPAAAASAAIGVSACDEYITKYRKCLEKAPAAAKDSMTAAFEQATEAWKKSAATADGKRALAVACKNASDVIAPSVKALGCAW